MNEAAGAGQYAEAHFNLARAYESQGQQQCAPRHWLGVCGSTHRPWAKQAKEQTRSILRTETLSIVSRRGQLVKAAD